MPPTLGQRLKHARERRGLSLRDVEHTTRIPVPRLQDLEDDKLNTFGGMTYAKCFLRTYATMLDVNADEVLEQIKPPPLSGARDYRYLVESHGPWVVDRRERQAMAASSPNLHPGKPFVIASLLGVAFVLAIVGSVVATTLFSPKTTTTSPTQGKEVTASSSSPSASSGSSFSTQPYLPPDQLTEEVEFSLNDARVTVLQKKPDGSTTPIVPPKAVPVIDPPAKKKRQPPKAEAVR